MIAFVPVPSKLSKTICARQTCFCVAVFDQIAKPIKVGRGHGKGNAGSHAADSHGASPPGIPPGIQMSNSIRFK
jgi:hypothetical protein